ncbi:hypothetical protein ACFC4S_30405 [Priestia megaterium]|uniref:YunG family protein n=1 Tax=Priestia megaterium TaxID=1404 RepID=UPI001DEDCE6C|nr:hypothetical protein [Priestia megaterium]
MTKQIIEIKKLLDVFKKTWSLDSSSLWTVDNPAKGQCGVTALVVNDVLGGEIFKTPTPDGWHFYNKINNNYYDFTESQFPTKIEYLNKLSNREEAFTATNHSQYKYLKQSVFNHINKEN